MAWLAETRGPVSRLDERMLFWREFEQPRATHTRVTHAEPIAAESAARRSESAHQTNTPPDEPQHHQHATGDGTLLRTLSPGGAFTPCPRETCPDTFGG